MSRAMAMAPAMTITVLLITVIMKVIVMTAMPTSDGTMALPLVVLVKATS